VWHRGSKAPHREKRQHLTAHFDPVTQHLSHTVSKEAVCGRAAAAKGSAGAGLSIRTCSSAATMRRKAKDCPC
jgi:hypothetical protein